ncbi:MAG: HAD family hydrolase [Betaproteobacteria bacterium]|nr:MAG: HAD family hydrolase [Betaproteobacteria bacterium]
MRAAVFLDRDGVLNETILRDGRTYPPRGVEELAILPGVEDACERLRNAGLTLVCVTNQPDVARGSQSRERVEAINEVLVARLRLDAVLVCYHDDNDSCACRKPKPGLLTQAAESMGIELRGSIMIGDRWRDIAAGQAAGCRTVFVDRGYQERRPPAPDLIVSNLAAAVPWVLSFAGAKNMGCWKSELTTE